MFIYFFRTRPMQCECVCHWHNQCVLSCWMIMQVYTFSFGKLNRLRRTSQIEIPELLVWHVCPIQSKFRNLISIFIKIQCQCGLYKIVNYIANTNSDVKWFVIIWMPDFQVTNLLWVQSIWDRKRSNLIQVCYSRSHIMKRLAGAVCLDLWQIWKVNDLLMYDNTT